MRSVRFPHVVVEFFEIHVEFNFGVFRDIVIGKFFLQARFDSVKEAREDYRSAIELLGKFGDVAFQMLVTV